MPRLSVARDETASSQVPLTEVWHALVMSIVGLACHPSLELLATVPVRVFCFQCERLRPLRSLTQ